MRSSWRTFAVAALAGVISIAAAGRAHAYIGLSLTSPTTHVAPGDTIVIQAVVLTSDSTLFNAFDLAVRFDPAMVTFVPTTPLANQIGQLMTDACPSPVFHLFNAAPDSTLADFSLLCNQTFATGPGTIYQLKFKSNGTSGVAKFSVGRGTRFLNAGVYVNPVLTQGVSIPVGNVLAVPRGGVAPNGYVLEAPRPNPWRQGASAWVSFSLPKPARVELALFDMMGRKVASNPVGDAPAGSSNVRWTSPGLAAGRYELRLRAAGKVVARQAWVLLQ